MKKSAKTFDEKGRVIYMSYDDYGDLSSEVWEEDGIYSAWIHAPEGVKKIHLTEEDGKRLIEINRESYNDDQRERRRHVSLEAMDPEDRFFTEDFDPLNELGDQYRKQLLREAIRALSPGQKDIVIQVYFMNRSQKEVAEEKGISPAAVNKQLSKALKHMRAHIEGKEG